MSRKNAAWTPSAWSEFFRDLISRKRLAFLLCGAAYLAAVVFAFALLDRFGGSAKETGWTWQTGPYGVVVRSVDPLGPAAGVLSPGDRILAVNGDPRAALAGPRPWLQDVSPGSRYSLTFESRRSGVASDAVLTMSSQERPADLAMGIGDALLSICFGLAGLLLWWARPGDRLVQSACVAALLMAFFLLGSAVGPVSPLLSGFALFFFLVTKSIFPLHLAAGCVFFARFPDGEAPGPFWKRCERFLWIGGVVVWAVTTFLRLAPHMSLDLRVRFLSGLDLAYRPELGLLPFRHGYAALCAVFIFAVAFSKYRRLTSAAMKLRVRWVVFGATAGVVPSLLASFSLAAGEATNAVSARTLQTLLTWYSVSTLSLGLIPATIAWAVLCHRLLGIRLTLSSEAHSPGARRLIQALTLIPSAGALLYLWIHRNLSWSEWADSNPVVLLGLIVAILAGIFRKELLDLLGSAARRLSYDRDAAVEGLLESLLGETSVPRIGLAASGRIDSVFHPERIVLLYREPGEGSFRISSVLPSSPAPALPDDLPADCGLAHQVVSRGPVFVDDKLLASLNETERSLIAANHFEIAAPVVVEPGRSLRGLILLGPKRSGESYTATDLDILEEIAGHVATVWKMRDLESARDIAVQLRERAEEIERSRIQFLAQMSHELRTPLHGVVGLTGLLLETPLSPEQKEYTQLIRRSGESLVVLANDLLDLTRADGGKLLLESVEIAWRPLLEDAVAIAAERARGREIEVVLLVDPEMPRRTIGDPYRIRQVLLNLLDNAIKFTPSGHVALRATAPDGAHIRLEVEDTGPGIEPGLRSRIFQPFIQGEGVARRNGAGLGLAICKQLVDAMEGEIQVQSETDRGTTFTVVLPIRRPASSALPAPHAPLEGVHLVCIDPLPISLQAVSQSLAALGALTISATSCDEIHATANVDAVVLSVNGDKPALKSMVRSVRRSLGSAPIILLRRTAELLTRAELADFGIAAQARRPASLDSLTAAVSAVSPSHAVHQAADDATGKPCSGIRVLVVEDDPATLRLTELTLEQLGCVPVLACDAGGALALLDQSIDLVLTDCGLPGMTGAELAQRIRSLDGPAARVPIIVLSGHLDTETRDQMRAAGASDYITKPASAADLCDSILALVAQTERHTVTT